MSVTSQPGSRLIFAFRMSDICDVLRPTALARLVWLMPAACCKRLSLVQNSPSGPGTPPAGIPPASFRCPVPSVALALNPLLSLPFLLVFRIVPVTAPDRRTVADCH